MSSLSVSIRRLPSKQCQTRSVYASGLHSKASPDAGRAVRSSPLCRAVAAPPAPAQELAPFKLERFLARYEFSTRYLLCCSDSQPLKLSDMLQLADDECQRLWADLTLSYTESAGLPQLRREVSELYGDGISDGDVIVLAPEEGIYLAMLALTKPGDRVVVTYPGYQSLYEVARSRGAELVFWTPRERADGSLHFDVEELQRLAAPGTNTSLVIVNFPHNPTGCVLASEEWDELVRTCERVGAFLFSDEMYRFLPLSPTAPPARTAVDTYERSVSLCGMSKAFGMPGIRIGWLASQDKALLSQVLTLKDYTTICSSGPSELLALIGLRARQQLLQRQLAMLRRNVAAADAFFSARSDTFVWHAPSHGTVAFPRLATGEPIDAFCERCATEAGVLLLPATVYDHAPSAAAGRFRLGFGRDDFEECLRAWGEYLDSAK